MADLGRAFVTIVPKAEGITKQIGDLIDPPTDRAGKRAGKALSTAIGNGITSAGDRFTNFAASGAAAIAGISASMSAKTFGGGLARAMKLDEASAKFKQLGFNWDKGTTNMKNSILASVDKTKYGLDEMAGVAVNFASTGIQAGDEMTNALKSVASAASISGVDVNHMGAIYTKVAAAGKLTGGVMQQLQENGINANAALQKALGKSSEDISKMVTNGEIDFKTFTSAMRDYFGDAADSANSTFSGASANVQAALNRIGANFTAGPLEEIRKVFAGEGFKGDGLMEAINHVNEALEPAQKAVTAFAENLGNKAGLALERFNKFMEAGSTPLGAMIRALINSGGPLEALGDKFDSLSEPVQSIIMHVAKFAGIFVGASAGIGMLGGAIGTLIPGLGGLLGPLVGAGGAFKLVSTAGHTLFGIVGQLIGGGGIGGLAGPLKLLTGPLGIVASIITALCVRSVAFRGALVGLGKTVVSSLLTVIKTLAPILEYLYSVVMRLITVVGNALAPVIRQLTPIIGEIITTVGMLVANIIGELTPLLDTLIPIISNILQAIMPILSTIVEVVMSAVNVILSVVTVAVKAVLRVVTVIVQKIVPIVSAVCNKVKSVFSKVWNAIGPIVSRAVNAIKSKIESIKSVVSKVTSTFNRVKEAILKPINAAKDKVKSIVEAIKNFFHFTVPTPHIPVPRFSISPSGWKMKDLLKGSIPHLSVTWGAKGGILDAPTLIGAGEAGKEALLPLDPFWKKIDNLADNMQGRQVSITNYITVDGAKDPEDYARRFMREMNMQARMA